MKITLLAILIFCFYNCTNKSDPIDKIKLIVDLIKSEQINEADSIHKTLRNDNVIDFDYRLLDLIIEFKHRNFNGSLSNSKDFIRRYPKVSFGYYYAGLNEYHLANYKSALTFFAKGLATIGESKNGFIYFDSNKKKYSNSFDEASIYNDLIYMLGVTNSSVAEFRNSNAYLKDCLSKKYKMSECYIIMGYNYEKLGDNINAKKSYLLAKELGNTDADELLKKF